jgi:hypothetical protein
MPLRACFAVVDGPPALRFWRFRHMSHTDETLPLIRRLAKPSGWHARGAWCWRR